MIRWILAALDGSDCGHAAGQYAAYLGMEMHAGIEALTVVDVRPLEGPMLRDFTTHLGLEPFESYTQALRDVLQGRADEILARFREDAARIGLPETRMRTVSEVGIIAEVICRHAEKVDLVVIGQRGEYSSFTGGLLGSTSEQIVRRATRPVMVCPPSFSPIRSPLVAYDGSPLADDALHLAADFASQLHASLAVLVVIDGEQMSEERAREVQTRAERYLACCELPTEIEVTEGSPDEQIVQHAKEDAHDLIVMGAFGRSRIRELLLGSTTAYVMRTSDVPVLLTRRQR